MKKILCALFSIIMALSVLSATPSFAATKPDKPYTFNVLKESSTSAKLYWYHINGATGYEIQRSTSKSSGFKKIATTSNFNYTDKKLSSSKTYYYKVRAYKTSNGSKLYSSYTGVKSINMKSAKIRSLNGDYRVFYKNENDLTVSTNLDAKLKCKTYSQVIIPTSTVNKLKKGSTFTVKYKASTSTIRTEKYKVDLITKDEGHNIYFLDGVSASVYNTASKKTTASKMYNGFAVAYDNGYYKLYSDESVVYDYDTGIDLYIYAPARAKYYDDDRDAYVCLSDYIEFHTYDDTDTFLNVTVEKYILTNINQYM